MSRLGQAQKIMTRLPDDMLGLMMQWLVAMVQARDALREILDGTPTTQPERRVALDEKIRLLDQAIASCWQRCSPDQPSEAAISKSEIRN
jgi:hypothetical protein